jgi:hypothetical protein
VRQVLRYHHYAYRIEKPFVIGSSVISDAMGANSIPEKWVNQNSKSLLKLLALQGKTGPGERNRQALMGYSI